MSEEDLSEMAQAWAVWTERVDPVERVGWIPPKGGWQDWTLTGTGLRFAPSVWGTMSR